ncbi:MAG: GTPase domain-containing protein [Deltaproteobacteria bacterium]|nr:GTPase domain-containing protein [Deltaproteobacteria bacterium]
MIEYDTEAGVMVIKLVYYGPALSGKTTNLMCLHDLLPCGGRGNLMVLDTARERTIYFDLLPFFITAPSGLRIKVKVFTVPGQVKHDATRKAVLQRADGVAFIADSQVRENLNNATSFENLEQNLALVGLDPDKLPLVIQYNKRDLPGITPEDEIRSLWRPSGVPLFFASALEGWGVVDTFECLLRVTYASLDGRYCLSESHGLSAQAFTCGLTCPEVSPGLQESSL